MGIDGNPTEPHEALCVTMHCLDSAKHRPASIPTFRTLTDPSRCSEPYVPDVSCQETSSSMIHTLQTNEFFKTTSYCCCATKECHCARLSTQVRLIGQLLSQRRFAAGTKPQFFDDRDHHQTQLTSSSSPIVITPVSLTTERSP